MINVKTVAQAKEIQEQLRHKVITCDHLKEVKYVAGVDIGFEDNYKISKAAIAVLSYPELELVEKAIARIPTAFPYVPGYLSFREIPAILAAFPNLNLTPDLILCDGQGLAHPRRFGLACHLGVLLDIPTIGVAKSRFIGEHEDIPLEKGSWKPLIDNDETIGVVLRSRNKVKPIYVSVGHKINLPTAIDYVMGCLTKYRIPETTRWADRLASSK
ncbi:deoxyribonuclease V [Waterburya agarophytonicola K14]|uniref:Endonuclease V n=1 Tax=Waterburya agarophytonicola KI4 TaxID=2874699 RepID=A0A964BNJ2_9CYAN|nr:deoxyribonuclease V [Waterburya agarophytonicola]MCC0175412.1 deoxyribonuclease V [Waterburya agarophytonicola KI4]